MSDPRRFPTHPATEAAVDLGRSYEAILQQQAWEWDVAEAEAPGSSRELPTEGLAVAATSAESAGPPPLVRIIEAMLFLGGPPLTAARAADVIRGLTPDQFQQAIDTLNADYRRQARPYLVQLQEQGWVLTLRPRYRWVWERMYGGVREARLSPAAVDVLALVAYRQPISKAEIESLRGAESGHLLRQLVRRGLIAVGQRGEAGGKEVCYCTTPRFLELFGLSSLDDLPRTDDLQAI
ncbi:MAG: SMC-Scp complex subunit ScpB [Gemmataceae bacterium]|nr:SMC-Scp complex subunit ScpB [Gemmataceae bacterium]MDW8264423.1 SMC-Scp complex subunit ScpB [Gemmataceae bacterium]